MSYPVVDIIPALREKLRSDRIVILQAPPGAGKSTVVPVELLNEPWLADQKIIMLEPRRLAAKSVAQRMTYLQQQEVGEKIGYRVRFDTQVSQQTKLEVVTEGILTRMIQSDNALEDVGLVIFDEFHERSLQADLALALCLQVQNVLRSDLRILIMSATLDAEALKKVLGAEVPVLTSEGKQFPIRTQYLAQKEEEWLNKRVVSAIRKAINEEEGDVLVFLPGAGEIQRVAEDIEQLNLNIRLHTLYADLPYQQQEAALLPNREGIRKVVLSTAIAETSLTIEGVKVVIDCGYARVPRFDSRSGLTRLETIRITKDSADQRRGRAGRLGPGVCYRLWAENLALVPQRKPEILEADLSSLVLELMQWGIKELNELTWITPPPLGAWSQAKELLQQLGAIDKNVITPQGKQMLSLPTHPRIAHMLTNTSKNKAMLSLVCDLAAVLEERDPLQKESGVDVALRVEALQKYRKGDRYFADRNVIARIEKLSAQWRKILKADAYNEDNLNHHLGELLLSAYPERLAQQLEKHGERYKMANGRVVKLPANDPLMREAWLCTAQVDAGQKEGKIFLAAAVDEKSLKPLAKEQDVAMWDEEREMVAAFTTWRIGNVVIEKKPASKPSSEQIQQILIETIQAKGLKYMGFDEVHEQWQSRVLCLKQWRANEAWPDVSENILLEKLPEWLTPYLNNIYKKSDLLKLDLLMMLQSTLPWELSNQLNALVPARLSVPSGSEIKLQYFADGRPPVMEVRLQEMFGLLETPTVNEGRNKIMLHLLSPGYKPVQVTQDLKSFWQSTYHEVRKELRMRYPRHHWPEDPWTAEAVRGVKRNRG
ncbi:MAG: ATP-dependent helicase HrpB [Cytophagia bacterium]|nr:ATP-dependent helicase HrpB [Cytophagia bacterium]